MILTDFLIKRKNNELLDKLLLEIEKNNTKKTVFLPKTKLNNAYLF